MCRIIAEILDIKVYFIILSTTKCLVIYSCKFTTEGMSLILFSDNSPLREGSLLPRGSSVLVQGNHLGTVVYVGHSRHLPRKPSLTQHYHSAPITSANNGTNEPTLKLDTQHHPPTASSNTTNYVNSPLGVTITLWPPGELHPLPCI